MNKLKKRFCIFLACVMLAAIVPVVPAAASQDDAARRTRIAEVKEILDSISYLEYLVVHEDKPLGSGDISVSLANDAGIARAQHEGREAVLLPEEGVATFNFNAPREGLYNLELTYMQFVGKTSSIERLIRINGRVPFREARYVTITKVYRNEYETDEDGGPAFIRDIRNNELRAPIVEAPEWRTVLVEDSSGFVEQPLMFYLQAGENSISFEAVREPVYLSEIKFVGPEKVLTYEQYLASVPSTRGTADIPRIQAEMPVAMSEIVIHPINDRSSAVTEPQDASRIRLNAIGGTRWQLYGDWIRYEFTVPAGGAGLYNIVPRFKQSTYSGVYSSRKIRINGKIPFEEANRLRFNFADNWQVTPLSDGREDFADGKSGFMFYFDEGPQVIEFEVSLGDMSEKLGRVEDSLRHMNQMYREIRMITGSQPDPNRDYGFARLLPLVLTGLRDQAANLRAMSAELESIIGSKGEHTVILDRIALQMERFSNNTDRIASGLDTFYGNIGGLGTWLMQRREQPLEIDYIQIHRVEDRLPRAEANFFQAVAFEFTSFIMSFFSDYDSVGVMHETDGKNESVEVWLGSSTAIGSVAGRDQAQIIRQMTVNFTQQTNIQTNVKLVAGGSLLPSVLAGVGPDVALYNGAGDAVNYAIRSAVQSLNHFQGDPARNIASFDTVTSYFHPSAMVPLTLRWHSDPERDGLVFGLPENQTFPMMFYRKDVLVELDIEIPRTWEDLYDIVPDLQKLNLAVGIAPGMGPLLMFMAQQNVPLYKGDGIEINFDDNLAIDAFKRKTELYTVYKFPVIFEFANRFRSGEMPIGLAGYDLYNQLTVFAPEIRGLWEFVPIPGTVREKMPEDEGMGFEELGGGMILDNRSVAGVSTSLMMRSAMNRQNTENAWAFMQWWVSADAQSRFGNEMIALMGAAAKQPTANREALRNMAWPTTDYRNLDAQFQNLAARPEVPGGYIVDRYIDFAWRDVYNNGASPVESILEYIVEINKELTRKRREFDMPVIERDRFGRRISDEELRAD